MRRILPVLMLSLAAAAHAAPPEATFEDMDALLADKGLLTRLENVSHQVADKAHTVAGQASELVVNAMGFLGVPYRRGGNSIETGFDCSGLIGYVYRDAAGISLPRTTGEMIGMQAPSVGKDSLQTGDVIFFAIARSSSHVRGGLSGSSPASRKTLRLYISIRSSIPVGIAKTFP